MSEQTLKFDHILVNNKDFHASKEVIGLDLVESSGIRVSDKFKHCEDGFKHFIGYFIGYWLFYWLFDDVIRPLCIVLPPMSGYVKYFDNGRKDMSFMIEDENVYLKYTGIWNKIKMLLSIKFHSQPIHDDKHIKTKVKTFSETINTLSSNNKVPEEINRLYCSNLW